jgi:hypothetical protein
MKHSGSSKTSLEAKSLEPKLILQPAYKPLERKDFKRRVHDDDDDDDDDDETS